VASNVWEALIRSLLSTISFVRQLSKQYLPRKQNSMLYRCLGRNLFPHTISKPERRFQNGTGS